MCTVSFTYDARNAAARRMIAEMRKSGLFTEQKTSKLIGGRRPFSEETEAFIYTSRHNAAKMFASKI